jgi:hypothetical protein
MAKMILEKTCDACPEQYDAYLDGIRVGYMRLRHGFYSVRCPDVSGVQVYSGTPEGDGSFFDHERDYYLRFGVDAILRWIAAGRPEHGFPMPPAPEAEYEVKE